MRQVKDTTALIDTQGRIFAFPVFYRTEKLLLAYVVLYTAVCSWVAYYHGILERIDFFLYASHTLDTLITFLSALAIFIGFKILWWKVSIKPSPLIRSWWPMLMNQVPTKDQLIRSIPVFIALFLFLSLFSNMKGMISYYGSYTWDPLLASIDRTIHLGFDPWRLLQPVLGYPIITATISFFYDTWMPIVVFFLYWQLLSHSSPKLRMQFFYTFILAWSINGTLLAIIFASGGPCFYELMTGETYFSEQMAYLRGVDEHYNILALFFQDLLLNLYQKDQIMGGVGISAMPSMHVATAFLFYLLTVRLNKYVGYIFAFYCFLILIGSVHLAWHYAIDGYFAIISTWVYWKLSGSIINNLRNH